MPCVLAVALLGTLLYAAFSANLDARLERMDLTGGARGLTEAEKANLGAAKAQAGVGPKSAIRIEKAIDDSFVGPTVGLRFAEEDPRVALAALGSGDG